VAACLSLHFITPAQKAVERGVEVIFEIDGWAHRRRNVKRGDAGFHLTSLLLDLLLLPLLPIPKLI